MFTDTPARDRARSRGGEPVLRVAFVWNDEVHDDAFVGLDQRVLLGGETKRGQVSMPLADGAPIEAGTVLVTPGPQGPRLLSNGLPGRLVLGGESHDLASQRGEIPLGPGDYVVVVAGPVAYFVQRTVRDARTPGRSPLADASLAASFGLSLFVHVALLLLCFLASRELGEAEPRIIDENVVARFLVTKPIEPPESEPSRDGGDEDDRGETTSPEPETARAREPEGRSGDEHATEDGAMAEARARVRGQGLLGALHGGASASLARALALPTSTDLLGGLGALRTSSGPGSGGAGLRGLGAGGGGAGDGTLLGAGTMSTGLVPSAGRNGGRGGGGLGGRTRQEARVSFEPGRPRVSGYLSDEQIQRVVQANAAAIRYCYEVEVQRQPSLRGRVEVAFRIDLRGSVSSARVGSSSLRNARVEGCVVRQVKRWRFPRPDGGEVAVSYPFNFGVRQ